MVAGAGFEPTTFGQFQFRSYFLPTSIVNFTIPGPALPVRESALAAAAHGDTVSEITQTRP